MERCALRRMAFIKGLCFWIQHGFDGRVSMDA